MSDVELRALAEAAPKGFVKCVICGAGMKIEHAEAHIQAHRDSGWDGTD